MYDVTLQSPDRFEFADLGGALQKALFSAIQGRPATVHQNGELVWEIEVDTRVSPSDRYHPAIVHFRRCDDDPYVPWDMYLEPAESATRSSEGVVSEGLTNPDKSRARS